MSHIPENAGKDSSPEILGSKLIPIATIKDSEGTEVADLALEIGWARDITNDAIGTTVGSTRKYRSGFDEIFKNNRNN